MLRDFTRVLRPAAARLLARAATASAVLLMFAALPACGIKGPLKPAPPAAVPAPPATVPPNPAAATPVKPTEPPPPAAPSLPATVKP